MRVVGEKKGVRTMLTIELIREVARKSNILNQKTAKRVVDAVFDTINESLAKGEKVKIDGFGTFMVVEKTKIFRKSKKLKVVRRRIHFYPEKK